MRKTIRSYETEIAEQFDLATNYDTNFVEILSTHFSRNPFQQKQLERNAAFLTTITILHNPFFFLDCNDKINMQWIEKHAPATETTRWNGIAFKVNNKLVTPLFVELSGGVEFNNNLKLYFESLSLFDECFVKRTYFTTVCSTTPRALQEFLKCTQLIYQYREGLLHQMD
ncbi:hypothetical protein BCV71DRAFT_182879 [Rhizopus microsporus]|uniref:Uncharacterized protein n=1 Tax=Rhizopus microsporus TaxID=58291 RepID=A0A1X0RXE3_RHIZD|nr:hypothetical protein BCV71DRAFT_182879 [Rhizopus microsporus]